MAKSRKKQAAPLEVPADSLFSGLEPGLEGLGMSLAEPGVTDPWKDVEYTGDRAANSQQEMSATLRAFRERAKTEQKRQAIATDSEYWACLCFQSREQKEVFLRAMAWLELGDKYLDGVQVAQIQGIDLPDVDLKFVCAKPDKTLSELSMPMD